MRHFKFPGNIRGGPIHLLLVNVVMPGMSGWELIERLTPLRHQMKVLCISGYTDDVVVQRGVLALGVVFLPKPLTPGTVTRRVREVVGE
jgi:two-component system cell cycle sensor histidine kinase/response regulator CckA